VYNVERGRGLKNVKRKAKSAKQQRKTENNLLNFELLFFVLRFTFFVIGRAYLFFSHP